MVRLPVIGSDADNWGALLNEFLRVSHHEDGTLKAAFGCVPTLATLKGLTPKPGQWVLVAGYYTPGDGGGGSFYWDAAASEAENGGTVIVPASHPTLGRWKRVVEGPWSVRWFGAKGDGNSHPLSTFYSNLAEAQAVYPHATELTEEIDWAAIQAALDVLAPQGGTLCFPSGTYYVTDTLRCGSGVICQGVGENSTIIKSSLTKAVFQSKDPSVRHYHIHLCDLQIDNTTRANVGSIGIDFSNVSSGIIQNVVIANVETGILLAGSAYYNKLSSVVISTAMTGIKMMNGANENHIFSGRIGDVTIGIKLDDVSNPQIYAISLEGFTTGIEIGPTAVASPKIFGCRFENPARSGTGISIASTTLAAIIIGPYFQNVTTSIIDSATDSNILADVHWKIGGGTAVKRHQRITAAIDFPAIAAQSTNDQLVAISGLTNVDSVFVTPDPNIPAGLLVMGIPALSNGVYIRLANITTTVIDPLPLTFTIDIWQHG